MATGKTVTVVSANLFRVALDYLGDATQWHRIAELNGTGPDPILPLGVMVNLLLPPINTQIHTGIYSPTKLIPFIDPPPVVGLTGADGSQLTGSDGVDLIGADNGTS